MKKKVEALAILMAFLCQWAVGEQWFYSEDSVPVLLSYETNFTLPIKELEGPVEIKNGEIQLTSKDREKVNDVLYKHVLHLYGVFTYHEKPVNFSIHSGAITEKRKPELLGIKKDEKENLVVTYRYVDEAVFYWELLYGEKEMEVEFFLPTTPTTIYQKGFPEKPVLDPKTKKPINMCTSRYDNSEEAFWYYWNPHQKGCPKAILKEIHLVKAKLKALPMTELTYPEYEKLYFGKNKRRTARRRSLDFNIFVGVDHKIEDPKDLGRYTFTQIEGNFAKLESEKGDPLMEEKNTENENQKYFIYDTDLFRAHIKVHFVDPEADDWDDLVRKTMRGSDVFIYTGHSSEGRYFDPERLFKKRTLPKDKYQVIFFNSCTSHSYFHSNYFALKKSGPDPLGTKNLDILSNAIGAPFLNDPQTIANNELTPDSILAFSLLGLSIEGKPVKELLSWQQIMAFISENAGYDYTALTNVDGDQDNPRKLSSKLTVPKPLLND